MRRVLGLDVAGVIIDVPTRLDQETWCRIKPRFLEVPPVAPLALMCRVIERFDCAHLISAASDEEVVRCTRAWLNHWGFWDACGVSPDNLIFCASGREKVGVIRALPGRLTMYVDDQPENLTGLTPYVDQAVFYSRGEGEPMTAGIPTVLSWEELLRIS